MAIRWPWRREPERRSLSLADPALFTYLYGAPGVSGQVVSEHTVLTLSAVWRAVNLVAGAVAGLPLRTLQTDVDGTRRPAGSFLDNPGLDRYTPFEWTMTSSVHLLLHGNAYLLHVYNGAGAIAGLEPIHPCAVSVDIQSPEAVAAPGGKLFRVTLVDGTLRTFDQTTLTHIPALQLGADGKGLSPIGVARTSLGAGLAGDKAAARQFANGAMISGILTTEDDVTEDEAREIKADFVSRVQGEENAGDVAFINRNLKFQPWTMTAQDAQFLESRTFQVEEVGRWFGVPPHLLGQTEKSTSWGTGIEEQNRGLARYTLAPWTKRIEQRLSRLIAANRWVEFDYSAFVQPSPDEEITLLIQQVNSGLLTLNEARAVRNLPPVEGGDLPRSGFQAPAAPAQEAPADA